MNAYPWSLYIFGEFWHRRSTYTVKPEGREKSAHGASRGSGCGCYPSPFRGVRVCRTASFTWLSTSSSRPRSRSPFDARPVRPSVPVYGRYCQSSPGSAVHSQWAGGPRASPAIPSGRGLHRRDAASFENQLVAVGARAIPCTPTLRLAKWVRRLYGKLLSLG